MSLTLILGPMKSGKSYELISHFAPLKYTEIAYRVYQPFKNVRDEQIQSRNGSLLEGKKIKSLREILEDDVAVVGIDEFHMFGDDDIDVVDSLLCQKKTLIISSLDTDYRGRLFDNVTSLFALGPKEVKFRRAVCEVCKIPDAVYTQIFDGDKPLLSGMPASVPEDGRFSYVPMCRSCFIRMPEGKDFTP
jgi:thymidine kinase